MVSSKLLVEFIRREREVAEQMYASADRGSPVTSMAEDDANKQEAAGKLRLLHRLEEVIRQGKKKG